MLTTLPALCRVSLISLAWFLCEKNGVEQTVWPRSPRGDPVTLSRRASNDTRDRAIIGGVVPNHRSRALQQQPSKMLCHLSSSKAVGHPLTACLVERCVIRTSYRDNASCQSRRNTALFFSVRLKNQLNVFS